MDLIHHGNDSTWFCHNNVFIKNKNQTFNVKSMIDLVVWFLFERELRNGIGTKKNFLSLFIISLCSFLTPQIKINNVLLIEFFLFFSIFLLRFWEQEILRIILNIKDKAREQTKSEAIEQKRIKLSKSYTSMTLLGQQERRYLSRAQLLASTMIEVEGEGEDRPMKIRVCFICTLCA